MFRLTIIATFTFFAIMGLYRVNNLIVYLRSGESKLGWMADLVILIGCLIGCIVCVVYYFAAA